MTLIPAPFFAQNAALLATVWGFQSIKCDCRDRFYFIYFVDGDGASLTSKRKQEAFPESCWRSWASRWLLLPRPSSTPHHCHIIPFLLPIFSLSLDWKGRDNLGLERTVRPGTLLIHLCTGQACWGQPLLDILYFMQKSARLGCFCVDISNRWHNYLEIVNMVMDSCSRSQIFVGMSHEIRERVFLLLSQQAFSTPQSIGSYCNCHLFFLLFLI